MQRLGGERQGLGKDHNSITKKLDTGKHSIKFALAGYEDIKFDITVVGGEDKTYHKTLTATKPKFTFSGYILLSPTSGKPGDTINASMSIKNDGNLAAPADVRGLLGQGLLAIKSTPSIAIGGSINYIYSFIVPSIPSGTKTIKIELLYKGDLHDSETVSLTVKEETASITFDSTPKGCSVYVDDTYIGTT